MQSVISSLGKVTVIRSLVTAIMGIENTPCIDTLFEIDFLDNVCIKLAISKSISWALFIGALIYKLPVIRNIMKSKRCTGFAEHSLNLETSAYAADAVYKFRTNLSFNMYGDSLANILSNCVIILFFWKYYGNNSSSDNSSINGEGKAVVPGLIKVDSVDLLRKKLADKDTKKDSNNKVAKNGNNVLIRACFLFCSLIVLPCLFFCIDQNSVTGHFPLTQDLSDLPLQYIAYFVIIFFVTSRVLQISSNFASGDVGVQSSITLFLAAAGSAGKAFNNSVEASDDLLLNRGGQLIAILNTLLFIQVLFYQKTAQPKQLNEKTHKD